MRIILYYLILASCLIALIFITKCVNSKRSNFVCKNILVKHIDKSFSYISNAYELAPISDTAGYTQITTSIGNHCFLIDKTESCMNIIVLFKFDDNNRVNKIKCIAGCVGYELVDKQFIDQSLTVLDSIGILCKNTFEIYNGVDSTYHSVKEHERIRKTLLLRPHNSMCMEYIIEQKD